MQDFLLAASQLAMTRAQSAANALADRIEELAVHATFVQVSCSHKKKSPFLVPGLSLLSWWPFVTCMWASCSLQCTCIALLFRCSSSDSAMILWYRTASALWRS